MFRNLNRYAAQTAGFSNHTGLPDKEKVMNSIQVSFVSIVIGVSIMIGFGSTFAYAANNTDPSREHAHCKANYSLCMDVAETDYNSCVEAGQSNCQANRSEDEASCGSSKSQCDANVANAVNCVNGTMSLPDLRLASIQYSVYKGTSVFTATAVNDGAGFQKDFIFELRVVGLYVARRHMKGLKAGEVTTLSTRLPLGTILSQYRVTSTLDTKSVVQECYEANNAQKLTNYLKISH